MKIVYKKILKDGAGEIKLIPENAEDFWHVYNLLAPHDVLSANTFRKVQKTSNQSTGSSVSQRVKVKITLEIEAIDFDSDACKIRVKGKNVRENRWIKLGAYHTVELAENRPFSLQKPCWDAVYLDRIELATDPAQSAEVAAIVMQQGLGQLYLITPYMTVLRSKIDVPIPRKRVGSSTRHDKGVIRFYEGLYDAIDKHIDFNIVKCVILASPGFFKDDFFKWVIDHATRLNQKTLLENKTKFMLCHASSGHKGSLNEILADPGVIQKMENTKATKEVKYLDDFFKLLNDEPEKAYYGYDHVKKADEANAIETLLVTDDLFRASDVRLRKQFVELVESVKDMGGNIAIFSSLHISGEQLKELTGVAAILRFPLHEIISDEEDESDDSDEEKSD